MLIFSKAKLKLQYRFYINQSEVEVVHSYKYLGLIITSNGSLKSSVSTLVNQARKAMFVLMKKAAYLNYPPPALLCKLFDALVAPVCEYACEWWGFQGKNDIELLHRKFCKMVLNVPPSATNVAVYGELGRMPMYLRREVLMIKYWLRLTSCFDISSLLWDCYNYHKTQHYIMSESCSKYSE